MIYYYELCKIKLYNESSDLKSDQNRRYSTTVVQRTANLLTLVRLQVSPKYSKRFNLSKR